MNLYRWLDPFLTHLRIERQLSPHTVAAYGRDLGVYESQFKRFHLDAHHYILTDLGQRGYAKRTLARKFAALRAFYRFIESEGISLDARIHIPTPTIGSHMPIRSLSHDQITALFAALQPQDRHYLRDRALLEILYGAGLRISECVDLTCGAVHFDQQWIMVMGKGRKERRVPLHRRACDAVQTYLLNDRLKRCPSGMDAPLFMTHSGGPYTRQGLYRIVRHYLSLSGCPAHFTPHSLRHAFATHLMDQKAGTLEVQQLLGHASIRSTQHYLSVQKTALKSAYQAHWAERVSR